MIRPRMVLPLIFLSASFTLALPPQKTQSFWTKVLKFLGVSSTPGNQKGDDEVISDGDINIYKVDTRLVLSLKQGAFRSPIFLPSDRAILALSGDKVVRIELITESPTEISAGALTELFQV